jgi:hypothetical protein
LVFNNRLAWRMASSNRLLLWWGGGLDDGLAWRGPLGVYSSESIGKGSKYNTIFLMFEWSGFVILVHLSFGDIDLWRIFEGSKTTPASREYGGQTSRGCCWFP